MPVGDKSKYTDKQERKAEHIAESYEQRGVAEREAERRAWATVNKDDGGGKRAERFGPRKSNRPSRRPQGRAPRRRGVRGASAGGQVRVSEESRHNSTT